MKPKRNRKVVHEEHLALQNAPAELEQPPHLVSEFVLFCYVASVIFFNSHPGWVKFSNLIGVLFAACTAIEFLTRPRFRASIQGAFGELAFFFSFCAFMGFTFLLFSKSETRMFTMAQVAVLFTCGYLVTRATGRTWPLALGFLLGVGYIWYFQGRHFTATEANPRGNRFVFAYDETDEGLNANSYGFYLTISVLMALKFLFYDQKKQKNFLIKTGSAILAILVLLIAAEQIVMTTGSRKAQLGLALIVFGSLFLISGGKIFSTRALIGAVFSLAALAGTLFWISQTPYYDRLLSLLNVLKGTGDVDGSYQLRSEMIKTAFQFWCDSPVWGHGFDSFAHKSGFDAYSHSNIMELLANSGIIGTSLYYGSYLAGIIGAAKLLRHWNESVRVLAVWIIISLLYLIFFSIFAVVYFGKLELLCLAVVLAVCCREVHYRFPPQPHRRKSLRRRSDQYPPGSPAEVVGGLQTDSPSPSC